MIYSQLQHAHEKYLPHPHYGFMFKIKYIAQGNKSCETCLSSVSEGSDN